MTVALHASCVVLGERGVLLRGPSGAGKSSVAEELVRRWRAQNRFARLVSDDRTLIEERNGRLLARSHPAVAGLLERRGEGVVPVAHEPACVLGAVVDLLIIGTETPPRMPDEAARRVEIGGVALPAFRCVIDAAALTRMENFIRGCYKMTER